MKLTKEMLQGARKVIYTSERGYIIEAIIHSQVSIDFIWKHYRKSVVSIYGSFFINKPSYLNWLNINASRE